MKQRNKFAFTLIELLVVIAVIGILSGLIVVSMSGITDKANIAKSQVFSNSLRNSLLSNLVSEWKFDNNAVDTWKGNNGTPVGSPTYKTSIDCVFDQCVELNGTSDFFTLASSITMTSEFTLVVWVYRDANSTYDFLTGMTGNDCKIGLNNGNNKMFVRLIAGSSPDQSLSSDIIIGKWNFIAVTRNSNNKVDVYINTIRSRLFSDIAQVGSFQMSILGSDSSSNYFDGKIDGVAIYDMTMPAFQANQLYYSGLNNLLMHGGIDKEEYLSRINSLAINE